LRYDRTLRKAVKGAELAVQDKQVIHEWQNVCVEKPPSKKTAKQVFEHSCISVLFDHVVQVVKEAKRAANQLEKKLAQLARRRPEGQISSKESRELQDQMTKCAAENILAAENRLAAEVVAATAATAQKAARKAAAKVSSACRDDSSYCFGYHAVFVLKAVFCDFRLRICLVQEAAEKAAEKAAESAEEKATESAVAQHRYDVIDDVLKEKQAAFGLKAAESREFYKMNDAIRARKRRAEHNEARLKKDRDRKRAKRSLD
jgi:hypothetical protein